MFEKGDYVFYENKGVCRVDEVTHMDIPGADRHRLYYALVPTGVKGSRIYSPTDNTKMIIRRIMTAEEAKELVSGIVQTAELEYANDKQAEDAYKTALSSCDPKEWIRIIKTLHRKRSDRAKDGKKITSTDGKYLYIVEDFLYGEISAALGIDRTEAKEMVEAELKRKAVIA